MTERQRRCFASRRRTRVNIVFRMTTTGMRLLQDAKHPSQRAAGWGAGLTKGRIIRRSPRRAKGAPRNDRQHAALRMIMEAAGGVE